MKVYIIMRDYDNEGYGPPLSAHTTYKAAEERICEREHCTDIKYSNLEIVECDLEE